MISLHIDFDKSQTAAIEAALAGVKNGAPRAMSRAINRAVSYGKTRASKLVREEYTLNAAAVKRATSEQKASIGNLHGVISWKGRPKQLRNFKHRKNKSGISVSVKKRSGYKRLGRRAFINTINSGPAIMSRVGASRYPIEVKHGPAVPQMTGNVNVEPRIRKDVKEKLDERMKHEMNAILKGYAK